MDTQRQRIKSRKENSMDSTALFFVVLLQCIVFGCITKYLANNKGYDSGFAWGFFLSIVGLIVVAALHDKRLDQKPVPATPPQQQPEEEEEEEETTRHRRADRQSPWRGKVYSFLHSKIIRLITVLLVLVAIYFIYIYVK